MAVKINVDFSSVIKSPWDIEKTFHHFANLEKTIPSNFPGLQTFTKSGHDSYRWMFENVKYGGYEFQIKFTTKVDMKFAHHIELTSNPQAGDSDLRGGWKFKSEGVNTHVHFDVKVGLELPIPFFLKSVAAPVTEKEISKLFERYVANVSKTLS